MQSHTIIVLPVDWHFGANRAREAHVSKRNARGQGHELSKRIHATVRSIDQHLEARANREEKEEPEKILLELEIVLNASTIDKEWIVLSVAFRIGLVGQDTLLVLVFLGVLTLGNFRALRLRELSIIVLPWSINAPKAPREGLQKG